MQTNRTSYGELQAFNFWKSLGKFLQLPTDSRIVDKFDIGNSVFAKGTFWISASVATHSAYSL